MAEAPNFNQFFSDKVDEIEWEKKREIDNAVDDCKRALEEKFSEERFEMRQDFKKTMNEMMRFVGGDVFETKVLS